MKAPNIKFLPKNAYVKKYFRKIRFTEFLQLIWLARAFDILFDKNCILAYNFFLVGKGPEFVRFLNLFTYAPAIFSSQFIFIT